MKKSQLKMSADTHLKPFVKWVGGKSKILNNPIFKNKLNELDFSKLRYIEPFVGGGAVFFHIKPKNAIINDYNKELITTYKILSNKAHLDELITRINKYYYEQNDRFCSDFYYSEREKDYNDKIKIAARFLYLNKACFNGIYRVNKKNQFNVPMGIYKNIDIYNEKLFKKINDYMNTNNIIIFNNDYKKLDNLITYTKNDFVYIDPPYVSTVKKQSFTQYTKKDFNEEEQVKVRDYCLKLDKIGAKFILSNFDVKSITELYDMNKNFKVKSISISHTVGGLSKTVKKAEEVIIYNF